MSASMFPAFTTPLPVTRVASGHGGQVSTAPQSPAKPALRRRVRLDIVASAGDKSANIVETGDVQIMHATTKTDKADMIKTWEKLGVKPDDADESHECELMIARDRAGRVVGTGRITSIGTNVEISRVHVLEELRGRGIGRKLVEQLISIAVPIKGALYVEARRDELGFYSLLGFETQGFEYMEGRETYKHMVYRFPVCAPSNDCVGLHHTSIRVSDIELSLAWYGCIGFTVVEKFFTPAGSRACFVEGLGVRLELVESSTGVGVSGVQDWPGFLVFDVTRGCSDLDSFLGQLSKRNGGALTVTKEPAHQVVGARLLSTCTVEDPDGLPIEFCRREGSVPSALLRRVDW